MTTTEYTLTDDWQEIGTGIASVQMIEGLNVWVCTSETTPAPDYPHELLTIGRAKTTVYAAVNSKIYAKRAPNSAEIRSRVVVEPKESYPSKTLNPDDVLSFPSATAGSGFIQTADNSEWAYLSWGNAGNLTVIEKSSGISLTDMPDTIWIAFVDGGVQITNRMSSIQTINYHITYK